jgi:hypothetical protein
MLRAVSINLCIMEEMLDLLPNADDSNGSIGCVNDERSNHILEICTHNNSLSIEDRETLFQMLIQESIHPLFEDWSDWQLILLESASHLATTPDLRFKWEDHLNHMISEEKDDSWGSGYFAERIAMLRYHVILSCEGKAQAAVFMRSQLQFSGFRELLIQEDLEHGQYDEVIQLAMEGEKHDHAKGLSGLVKKWKKYRYEAYKLSGQIELQRLVGEELVLEGEFIYYQQLKETYSSADWRIVYKSIIEKLEKDRWPRGIYTMILIEEHETGKLLEYIRKQPSRVEDYYMHLIHEYPLEVKGLFQAHIEVGADRANTRKHYQDVCRMIHVFKQACGKEEASQIIFLLKQKYPRKPAFLDELMSI